MANWKYKVNLTADWKLANDGVIDAKELSQRVVAALEKLNCHEFDLDDIIDGFKELDDDADFDDFDEVLEQLYNWGDITLSVGLWPPDKLCWIGTF